jgi:hypothetical protein
MRRDCVRADAEIYCDTTVRRAGRHKRGDPNFTPSQIILRECGA